MIRDSKLPVFNNKVVRDHFSNFVSPKDYVALQFTFKKNHVHVLYYLYYMLTRNESSGIALALTKLQENEKEYFFRFLKNLGTFESLVVRVFFGPIDYITTLNKDMFNRIKGMRLIYLYRGLYAKWLLYTKQYHKFVNATKKKGHYNLYPIEYEFDGPYNKMSALEAEFSYAYLENANFNHCVIGISKLQNSYLKGAKASRGYFIDDSLSGANLTSADLRYGSYHYTNISNTIFEHANLEGFQFKDQPRILRHVNFRHSNLTGAYFRDADCQDSCFEYSTITNTDFGDTDLTRASFYGITNNTYSQKCHIGPTQFLRTCFEKHEDLMDCTHHDPIIALRALLDKYCNGHFSYLSNIANTFPSYYPNLNIASNMLNSLNQKNLDYVLMIKEMLATHAHDMHDPLKRILRFFLLWQGHTAPFMEK